jgi:hypothetical protein
MCGSMYMSEIKRSGEKLRTQSRPSATDAVSAVRNTHTALNRAENIFRFPRTLLRRYVKWRSKVGGSLFKLNLAENRSSPLNWRRSWWSIYCSCTRLFGLTTQDVKRLTFHLPTRNDPKNHFVQLGGTAGKDGFYRYDPKQGILLL